MIINSLDPDPYIVYTVRIRIKALKNYLYVIKKSLDPDPGPEADPGPEVDPGPDPFPRIWICIG